MVRQERNSTPKRTSAGCAWYLVLGTIQAVFWIGIAVLNHRDHLRAEARIPLYQADCAHATRYSPATPSLPCYDVQTRIALNHHSGSKSSYDWAELTLPTGKHVTTHLDSTGWGKQPPPSGLYDAEVWNGAVTKIVVNGQTIRTRHNPVEEAQITSGSAVTVPAIIGGVAGLLVITGVVLLVKGSSRRNS